MLAVALVLASVAVPAAGPEIARPPWLEPYEAGVRDADEGRWRAALRNLQLALEIRSEEALSVSLSGSQRVDYLPHLYLAIVHHMLGETGSARVHLGEAERAGVAEQSHTGALLLVAYRDLIEASAPPGVSWRPLLRPRFGAYKRRPTLLDLAELQRLQRRVLTRCAMPESDSAGGAPWYYYYYLALELEDAGDDQRAIDALLRAIAKRPRPQRSARAYGMWFFDYLPYSQIVRAHARLGNRRCAMDALLLAQRLGEVGEQDGDLAELRALIKEMR